MNRGEVKKLINERKRLFLLGFFSKENENETLELNGFLLFKHWDGNYKRWTVDIFTPESYRKMKEMAYTDLP